MRGPRLVLAPWPPLPRGAGRVLVLIAILSLGVARSAWPQGSGGGFTPATAPWRDGPWPGTRIAMLETGGAGEASARTFWMLLPDGFWILPHTHPSAKRVNVISGTLLVSTGETFDPAAGKPLTSGGFQVVPANTAHFEGARGETIVQFSAVGPWATRFLGTEEYRVVTTGPKPCAADSAWRELEFWVGEWDVFAGGRRAGTNRIEPILGGCALVEHWTDASGREGKSLFYYQPVTAEWKQVWVTEQAGAVGGLKEKTLVERLPGGALRFQGEIPLPNGRSYLDRTTLTPLPDGRVWQRIEVSRDRGRTWETTFDAEYARR